MSLLLHSALGLEASWPTGLALIGAAALGGLVGVSAAQELEPYRPKEKRDVALGWGALVGAVGAVACLLIPLPWGAVAAAAVAAATLVTLRRV